MDATHTTNEIQALVTPDGARLHVEEFGTVTPVVSTHGWAVAHEMWEYQMASASPRARGGLRGGPHGLPLAPAYKDRLTADLGAFITS